MNETLEPSTTTVKDASADKDRSHRFVDYIIKRCNADTGTRAALKRASNPSTEYQSWGVLADFRVDLEMENKRLPYATIAAAIANANATGNGPVKIGSAIARCYEDGSASDQARRQMRRLLACDSVPEVCRLLRPLFALIQSKSGVPLDYASLLTDLIWFGHDNSRLRIRARWAQDFYGKAYVGGMDSDARNAGQGTHHAGV